MMKRLTKTFTQYANYRRITAAVARVLMLVCLSLLSLLAHADKYHINFDPTLDSSDFFNIASVEQRNSYVVASHWWSGVGTINISGLNNDELYASAQSLRDNSMSLNHKLLNHHWLSNWHYLGNNSLLEDNTKKELRKIGHLLLSYTWSNYRKHSVSTDDKPAGQLNIKYRVRVNHDKAKLSLSIGF